MRRWPKRAARRGCASYYGDVAVMVEAGGMGRDNIHEGVGTFVPSRFGHSLTLGIGFNRY